MTGCSESYIMYAKGHDTGNDLRHFVNNYDKQHFSFKFVSHTVAIHTKFVLLISYMDFVQVVNPNPSFRQYRLSPLPQNMYYVQTCTT